MISVILLGSATATGRPAVAGDAVRTLSALVPGTVDGVIRDVQVVATMPEPDLTRVAEHAGCAHVAGDPPDAFRRAAAAARSPYVLVLLSGLSFDRALTDEMAGVATQRPAWIERGVGLKTAEGGGLLRRLLPGFAPTGGVLTTKRRLEATSSGTVPALWRALRPRRAFETRCWSGAA